MLGLRRLLHDENAQQLFETIRHLKTAEPAGAVLENVMGFLKVIPKILKLLAENLPQ
ncbi:unnamed protein product [Cladocopium goreaui]|uniref:Uncharacterized protein n=1 Tax=Cladocopium goreaui TaxID=2562237 RepID=A0A9P1D2L8_9DINO|nr:unnamed protein product [Cladocopium goreaui]CAI4001442.1 unnamed protein product [Cladocopium goreaui]